MAATDKIKIGINGFGRIGRLVTRAVAENPKIEIVAINDPFMAVDYMKHQLKYDSVHGRYPGSVEIVDGKLTIDGAAITTFDKKAPKDIPWATVGVEYVAECTGCFLDATKSDGHINQDHGAKKVVFSAPAKDTSLTIVKIGRASCRERV